MHCRSLDLRSGHVKSCVSTSFVPEKKKKDTSVETVRSRRYLLKGVIDPLPLLALALFCRRSRLPLGVLMLVLSPEADDGVVGDSVHVVAQSEKADLTGGEGRRNRHGREGHHAKVQKENWHVRGQENAGENHTI